jgi:hypothetical protein
MIFKGMTTMPLNTAKPLSDWQKSGTSREAPFKVCTCKQKALNIFKRNEIQATPDDVELGLNYNITIQNMYTNVFIITILYVFYRAPFQIAVNCIGKTYEIMKYTSLRSSSRRDGFSCIILVCAVNLQGMKSLVKNTWAFSLALDSSTNDSTSYLDTRIRFFNERSCSIVNCMHEPCPCSIDTLGG